MPFVKTDDGRHIKVACWPCIRGHRSSSCGDKHSDRVLVEVRKPGRPMTSCPHSRTAKCECSTSIAYTIPKGTGTACGFSHNPPILAASSKPTFEVKANLPNAPWSNRIQKPAGRTPLKRSLTDDLEASLKLEEEKVVKEEHEDGRLNTSSVGCCGTRPTADDEASPVDEQDSFACDSQPCATMRIMEPPKTTREIKQPLTFHSAAHNGFDVNGIPHNCNCGDGCICLGCAAHPQNETTSEYVRKAIEYQKHHIVDPLPEAGPSTATWHGQFALPGLQTNFQQAPFDFSQSLEVTSANPLRPVGSQSVPVTPYVDNGAFAGSYLPQDAFSFQEMIIGCPNTDGNCCCMICSCQGCVSHSGCIILSAGPSNCSTSVCRDDDCSKSTFNSSEASNSPLSALTSGISSPAVPAPSMTQSENPQNQTTESPPKKKKGGCCGAKKKAAAAAAAAAAEESARLNWALNITRPSTITPSTLQESFHAQQNHNPFSAPPAEVFPATTTNDLTPGLNNTLNLNRSAAAQATPSQMANHRNDIWQNPASHTPAPNGVYQERNTLQDLPQAFSTGHNLNRQDWQADLQQQNQFLGPVGMHNFLPGAMLQGPHQHGKQFVTGQQEIPGSYALQ